MFDDSFSALDFKTDAHLRAAIRKRLKDKITVIVAQRAGAIARAFLRDPEILILDEAASHVDSRTERIVQKARKRLMSGRTSFVIAHRLSIICDADRIVVMERGDIVETGAHAELLPGRAYNLQQPVPPDGCIGELSAPAAGMSR